jgi:hypothetical protein
MPVMSGFGALHSCRGECDRQNRTPNNGSRWLILLRFIVGLLSYRSHNWVKVFDGHVDAAARLMTRCAPTNAGVDR